MKRAYLKQLLPILLASALLVSASIREHALNIDNDSPRIYSKGSHPLVTFVIVGLGGFRGIVADMLWLRTSLLQEKGRYVELVQLAEWVTQLQPHAESIWGFHAWNLAYNVSVMMDRDEDRWRWVNNGICLLRDKGLLLNPESAHLHAELGWIYQHKIGASSDSANMYYRKHLAEQVQSILGGGELPHPLKNHHITALRNELKMDTALMQEIIDEFGTIDWRVPQAHSLYWAYKGRKVASGFDALRCERMMLQSLASMIRTGRLEFTPLTDAEWQYQLLPHNIRIESVNKRYMEAIAKFPSKRLDIAHRYFLASAIATLEYEGKHEAAKKWLKLLHLILPPEIRKPDMEEIYSGNLDLEE